MFLKDSITALVLSASLLSDISSAVALQKEKTSLMATKALTGETTKALTGEKLNNLKFQLPEPKTLEKLGINEAELTKQAEKLKNPSEIYEFVARLLEKGVSPEIIEKILPTIKIEDAPNPLSGVVEKYHESDLGNIDSLNLPKTVDPKNLKEFLLKILIPRKNDPKYIDRVLKFVNDKVLSNDKKLSNEKVLSTDKALSNDKKLSNEKEKQIIASINKYLEKLRGGQIESYTGLDGKKGDIGQINPYILERAITRIIYILANNSIKESSNNIQFREDIYYLLVALGEPVEGAKKLIFQNGESCIVMPINKRHALALDSIGIKMPIEWIEEYKDLYAEFMSDLGKFIEGNYTPLVKRVKTQILRESIKTFETLGFQSQISILERYKRGLESSSFSGNNTKDLLIINLISLQDSVDNYIRYLEGGELDTTKSLDLSIDAQSLNARFPGILDPVEMENFIEFDKEIGKKLDIELKASEDELKASEDELKGLQELFKKAKKLKRSKRN